MATTRVLPNRDPLARAVRRAERAKHGDSNDAEISALNEALNSPTSLPTTAASASTAR